MEFELVKNKEHKDKQNNDAKWCNLGSVCINAIKCVLMACQDFASKVKSKSDNNHDKNDNRLSF